MEEQIVLLKNFILETPASNSEHKKQQGRLQSIVEGYENQLQQLRTQNEALKAKVRELKEPDDELNQ